jgi:hypothetical protein
VVVRRRVNSTVMRLTAQSRLALLLAVLAWSVYSVCAQATKPDRLYLVQRIYIGDIQDIDDRKRINSFLKQELEARGFVVVDTSAAADAVLTGRVEGELPLDNENPDYLKATFEFQLVSGDNQRLWGRRLRIHTKLDAAIDAKNGARAIAAKLKDDLMASQKKAGIVIRK